MPALVSNFTTVGQHNHYGHGTLRSYGSRTQSFKLAPMSWSPLVFHRWFADGEGWAYGPVADLAAVRAHLAGVLKDRNLPPEGKRGMQALEDKCILWYHRPDENVVDPKVARRHPTVLGALVLPARPQPEWEEELFRRLREFPVPDRRGRNERLQLEIDAEWLSQSAVSAATEGTKATRLSLAAVIAILGVVILAGGLVGWSVGGFFGSEDQPPCVQVNENLLRPLGRVVAGNPPDAEQVCKQLRQTYCKEGILGVFFPGVESEDLEKLRKYLDQLHQSPAVEPSGVHPDAQFLRQYRQWLQDFIGVYRRLPEKPIEPQGLRKLIQPSANLQYVLNQVAEEVKKAVKEGGQEVEETATGRGSLAILDKYVVQKLLGSKDQHSTRTPPWSGEYEKWFFQTQFWMEGQPFPWEEAISDDQRKAALLFARRESFPSDQTDAARAMQRCLHGWGVKGIREADVYERPWFVGRCFVEFLSQKHFSAQECIELQGKPYLYYVFFRRLLPPEEIDQLWPPEDRGGGAERLTPDQLWEPVKEGLKRLTESLKTGVSPTSGDKALVDGISNAIAGWGEAPERIRQINKTKREEEEVRRQQSTVVGTEDYRRLSEKAKQLSDTIRQLRESLAKLLRVPYREEDPQIENKYSEECPSDRDHCRELWQRLTGGKTSQ